MQSRIFAVVVTAVIVLTAGDALAVGSTQRPPVIDLGVTTPISHRSALHIVPNEILQGCGSHRRYDPVSQTCRGPADF
jgi:hypothetical protein